jgi:hypothetical protein
MGYRGEDASRTRAAWGRQAPWQASPDTGPADAVSWGDGSQGNGYDADAAGYPADDDYGYGYQQGGYEQGGYRQDDGGNGYGDGDGRAGGYADTSGFNQRDEYGHQGADDAAGYGQQDTPGYGGSGGYGQQDTSGYSGGYGQQGDTGYGGSGGYGQQDTSGYSGSGGYGQQGDAGYGGASEYGQQHTSGYGGTGAYPSRGSGSGGYPAVGSGGYPTLPTGSGGYPEQDAGNDWYGGQPAAASGASFADTGTYTLNGRVIDEYGTGPREALRDPVRGYPPTARSGPQRLAQTTQQEIYYDDHDSYDATGGFGVRGYDGYAGDQSGYGAAPQGNLFDRDAAYGDVLGDGDPYEDRYGEPGAGRGSRRKGRAARANPDGRPRRKRPLLLAVLAVVAVVVVGAAAYVYVVKPSHHTNTNAPGALPSAGSQPSAQQCVQEFGTYCHIENRTLDPAPLTVAELYPPEPTAVVNGKVTDSFTLAVTKLDSKCASAVIGSDLTTALQAGNCTQVLRASYISGDGKIMGTIGVVNLATTTEAHRAGRVVGENDFIAPLAALKGVASKLGQGTGVVEAEYKGHYLILTWSEFTNGTTPSTTAQDNELEQFSNELVAGTVNISLSERMVTGAPATPAATASASS